MLRAVSERSAYANLALPALLRQRGISGRDAAFATELTYGACRTQGLLDAVISAAAGRPTQAINPVLLDLLRLGTYQLLRTRVDAYAAVSTTVEQAGIELDSARAGFVNGVLRTIAARDERSWVDELAPDRSRDPIGHAAFVHAHPRWIAQAFADALGAAAGELDAVLTPSDNIRPRSAMLPLAPVLLSAWPGSETERRRLYLQCGKHILGFRCHRRAIGAADHYAMLHTTPNRSTALRLFVRHIVLVKF